MPLIFNVQDWYWFVGGNTTLAYSSARNIYVDPNVDANYATWVTQTGLSPPLAADESEIWFYVQAFLPSWLWNGTTMSQPGAGQYTKGQLIAYAAQVRYNTQIGGTVAAGVPVATDDRGLMLINGARWSADGNPNWTTVWVGADKQHYTINQAQMIAITNIVTNRTEQTFTTFNTVVLNINNLIITTLVEIDAAFASIV